MTRRRVAVRLGLAVAVVLAIIGEARARMTGESPVVTTVTVAGIPVAVALDERFGHAFIVDGLYGNAVTVLDTASGVRLRNVAVGQLPFRVAVDSQTGHAFVDASDGTVSMLDTRRGTVLRRVTVGATPNGLAVDVRRGHVFVSNQGAGTVTMLDARTSAVLRTVAAGYNPFRLAVDERTGRAFVVSLFDNSVAVLNTATGSRLRTVATGISPVGGKLDPRARYAWVVVAKHLDHVFVGNPVWGRVSILDGRDGRVSRTIPLAAPRAAAVDEVMDHVFVASSPGGAAYVSMLDARSGAVLQKTSVGASPTALAVDDRARLVFVATTGPLDSSGRITGLGGLSVLDADSGKLLRTVTTGINPFALAVDESRGRILVVNAGANNNGGAVYLPRPLDSWTQLQLRLHQRFPFIPLPVPPPYSIAGSVTVLDVSRLRG